MIAMNGGVASTHCHGRTWHLPAREKGQLVRRHGDCREVAQVAACKIGHSFGESCEAEGLSRWMRKPFVCAIHKQGQSVLQVTMSPMAMSALQVVPKTSVLVTSASQTLGTVPKANLTFVQSGQSRRGVESA